MTDLEHYFDVIERAAMSKALEKGDEKLAGEAAAARERSREEFRKLREEAKGAEYSEGLAMAQVEEQAARIAELESQLLKAQQRSEELQIIAAMKRMDIIT